MTLRGVAASFDAIVMVAAAFIVTGGSFEEPSAVIVIWGSAAAAVAAALAVILRGPSLVGWAAIGYVLFASLLAATRPVPLLLALAIAYMPLLERPRGSLAIGLAASVVVAMALAVVARLA